MVPPHHSHQRVEVTLDVMKKYEQHLRTQADGSAWVSGCGAWYIDKRTNTLTALWPGYAYEFRAEMADIDQADFRTDR